VVRLTRRVSGILGLATILLASLLCVQAATALHLGKSESSGSWVERAFRVSILNQLGLAQGNPYAASPSYEETITGTVYIWVNSTTECVGASFKPVSYGSVTAATEWKAAGFATDPLSSQVEGIRQRLGSGLDHPPPLVKLPSDGMTPIEVSGLPQDPARLAAALAKGRTGSLSLDQTIESSGSSIQGFERAALLLLAPRSGDSLAFRLELLHALGKLPGVHALGTVMTHSGLRGQAFTGGSGPNADVVVVSPRTGQLLELKNTESYPWALEWLEVTLTSFDPNPNAMSTMFYPPISSEMHLTAQWIDLVSSPQLVRSNVPSTLRFLPST
jgi:hypothetical protein